MIPIVYHAKKQTHTQTAVKPLPPGLLSSVDNVGLCF